MGYLLIDTYLVGYLLVDTYLMGYLLTHGMFAISWVIYCLMGNLLPHGLSAGRKRTRTVSTEAPDGRGAEGEITLPDRGHAIHTETGLFSPTLCYLRLILTYF